jgi:hypothetical protein
MPAGYSGTPLAKKLGIKKGHIVLALGAPAGYVELLEGLPDNVLIEKAGSAGQGRFGRRGRRRPRRCPRT